MTPATAEATAASAPRPSDRWRRMAAAALAGLLYFAAFPPVGAGLIAFVALVPLVIAIADWAPAGPRVEPSRIESFVLGWICCSVAGTLLVGASVYEAAVRYFDLSPLPAAAAAVLVPQLYGAPFFALFALLAREIVARGRGPATTAVAIAASWTATEFLRSTIGDGVPWLLLAHSQTARPWLIQTADLAGAHGPSFLVALVNAAIALAILELRRRGPSDPGAGASRDAGGHVGASPRARLARLAATTAVALGAAAVYGNLQLARWSHAEGEPLRVALIQGNLPDAWRYSLASLPDALRRMTELTREVVGTQPDLVVWPENAISISVEANREAFDSLAAALPSGSALLIGSPRAVTTAPGRAALRNSALLIDDRGNVLGAYDKQRLTPWAETPPWPLSSFGHLLRRSPSAYAPGAAPEPLELDGHRFAALICSEAIYPDLVRASVERGAEMLVVLGNDGWFGTQPAGEQHLDAVILRAVEARRPVIRATTTGITALIDPRGIVRARAPQNEPATLVGEVVPIPATETTPYTRLGDAFALASAMVALASLMKRRGAQNGAGE